MMKLVALTLLLASTGAVAHSHEPRFFGGKDEQLQSLSLSPKKVIPITVGNINGLTQQFLITVNDKPVADLVLKPFTEIDIRVPVQISRPMKVEHFQICSISVPASKEGFGFRMCTDAQVFWSKK
jgi:hypothetical protein